LLAFGFTYSRRCPWHSFITCGESHIAGRVLPVRHYGSVDVFLEAMGMAQPGDILVIDKGGRMDEGCIGDKGLRISEHYCLGLPPGYRGTQADWFPHN